MTAAVAGPSFKVNSPPYCFDHSVNLFSFVKLCDQTLRTAWIRTGEKAFLLAVDADFQSMAGSVDLLVLVINDAKTTGYLPTTWEVPTSSSGKDYGI